MAPKAAKSRAKPRTSRSGSSSSGLSPPAATPVVRERVGSYDLLNLVKIWDDNEIVRDRIRENHNLCQTVHVEGDMEMIRDAYVEGNVANVKANVHILEPVIEIMGRNERLLPNLDNLIQCIDAYYRKAKKARTLEHCYQMAWSIRRMIQVVKGACYRETPPEEEVLSTLVTKLGMNVEDWVPIRKPASRKPTTTFDSQEETARDAEDPGSVPGPAVDGSGSMAVDTPADKGLTELVCISSDEEAEPSKGGVSPDELIEHLQQLLLKEQISREMDEAVYGPGSEGNEMQPPQDKENPCGPSQMNSSPAEVPTEVHTSCPGPVTVVLESLQLAGDCDSTQLPCSPGTMMNTDVVTAMLKATHEIEDQVPSSPMDAKEVPAKEVPAKEVPAILGEQAEEDVVTRRMQFRMKKNKKAHKQQAAEERKDEKERKKKERLQKKQEKEQAKVQQAEEKRLAKEQKKAEKAAAKKQKGNEVQEEEWEPTGCTVSDDLPCATDAPDCELLKAKGLNTARTTKRTKRKLMTLRHGAVQKRKKTTVKSRACQKAIRPEAGSVACAATTNTTEKAEEEPTQETNQQEEPCCDNIQASAGSDCKQGKPALQHKGAKKKHGAKQVPKQAKKKSPAVKTTKKKCKPEPCPKIVKLVQQVLTDCKSTNCVHPTWENMAFDAKTYQLSVYWTRKAVGLKMPKDLLQGRKASKRSRKAKGTSKWAQVQYFSCKTSCVYTNLLLAYEFVKALTSQDSPDPKADDMIALAEQLKVSHAHAVESMEKPIK